MANILTPNEAAPDSASCWNEQLTANVVGKVRRETLDGRTYLVAPISALVPGVLNGSKGPLMYTPEDVKRATPQWDGVPIVVYHPTRNGKAISAREEGVTHIGFTKNAKFDGKLTFEGWYDEELTKQTDPRVHDAIVNGTPMEVSTGLGTNNEEAEGSYLGRKFVAYARNHKPDHIAMLPDQRGACSLDDGCGLHVNQKGKNQVPMGEKIAKLTGSRQLKSTMLEDGLHHHLVSDDPERAAKTAAKSMKNASVSAEAGIWTIMAEMGGDEHMFHFLPKELSLNSEEPVCTNCSADGECEECKKKRLKKAAEDAAAMQSGAGQTTNSVTANQLSHDDLRNQLQQLVSERFGDKTTFPADKPVEIPHVSDVFDKELIFQHRGKSWRIGYSTDLRSDAVSLSESEPVEVKRVTSYRAVQNRLVLERVGQLVKNDTKRKEADMAGKISEKDRQYMVDGLIANSGVAEADIWKEEDREVLNGMSDERLYQLAMQKQTLVDSTAVVNAVRQDLEAGEGSLADLPGFVRGVALNAKKFPFQKKANDDEEDEEMDDDDEEASKVSNQFTVPRQMTEQEWLKAAPQSVRSDLEYARQLQNKEKGELIAQITANVSGQERDQAVDLLKTKTLPELRVIANCTRQRDDDLLGVSRQPHYAGQVLGGVSMTANRGTRTPKAAEVLPRSRIDWAQISNANAGKK